MPANINLYHFGNPLYSIRFYRRCRTFKFLYVCTEPTYSFGKSFPQFIERFPVKQTAFLQFFHL